MENVTLIGIDTAKNSFHFHAVDKNGKKIYQRKLTRSKLIEYLNQHPLCTIAIEACSGSHHWAQRFKELGHTVLIINARQVKKFASSRNKNDYNDAKAITKAARDPDTYFVAPKSIEQQEAQAVHMFREACVKDRTMMVNRSRALLIEFGIPLPLGRLNFMKELPLALEDAENKLPSAAREMLHDYYARICGLDKDLKKYNALLEQYLANSSQAKRLTQIPGVGTVISTAMTFMIPDPKLYKNGRNCSAALGLTPKEHSTGGKQRLGRISREGNAYLRKMIVQGAQSVLRLAGKKDEPLYNWAYKLKERRGHNVAAIALANRIVRIAWAMLAKEEDYNYQASLKAM